MSGHFVTLLVIYRAQTRGEMGSPVSRLPSSPSLETDIEAAARLAPLAGFLTGRDCPWFTLPYHHDLLR